MRRLRNVDYLQRQFREAIRSITVPKMAEILHGSEVKPAYIMELRITVSMRFNEFASEGPRCQGSFHAGRDQLPIFSASIQLRDSRPKGLLACWTLHGCIFHPSSAVTGWSMGLRLSETACWRKCCLGSYRPGRWRWVNEGRPSLSVQRAVKMF